MTKSLTDGIFDSTEYEVPKPLKKDFLAWHKPRKQFVRKGQWSEQISKLLIEYPPSDGVLRYMGLPGTDLLDLRYFHNYVCSQHQLELKFLGFVKGDHQGSPPQIELNISLDEVYKLPYINNQSRILPDDFCLLADESSNAWNRAKEFGFFDVVNLDLCDGFGAHSPNIDINYYKAMSKILTLQAKNSRPWLLFLTTKTGLNDVHEEVLDKLVKKFSSNINDHEVFRDTSNELIGASDDESLQQAMESPNGHLSIYLTGLCKWILGLALEFNPPLTMEIKSTIGYQVSGVYEHDDLVSIAIKFTPTDTPPIDSIGLANFDDNAPCEGRLASQALRRLEKRLSADEILTADEQLMGDMIQESTVLLESARYDSEAYQEWLLST